MMKKHLASKQEETLDPLNWDDLSALGCQMVEDMLDFLKNIRNHPFKPMPREVLEKFHQSLPVEPIGYEKTYREFLENIMPYPVPTIHPHFWGFVAGTGSPYGVLAEMLAAGMNFSAPGFCSPVHVEKQVIEWLKEIMHYPPAASGVLVSGGSMANLTGLAVARNAKALTNIKKQGLQGSQKKMVLYVSTEGHKSLTRAVELLGLGNESLRVIPINENYQIDIRALEETIQDDKKKGCHPFCVIGNAGTTNTGAFDHLNDLADLCERDKLWFHVDGAFGAWATLSSTHNHLVHGMERADSIAFDLHKWMYMPYEVGCILVRDKEVHCDTFIYEAEYLETVEKDRHEPTNYSVQLSRNFKALKVWMLLKADGIKKYGRLIQQNIDQAYYLAELLKNKSEIEILAPVSLNIVCFRYVKKGMSEENIKLLNKQILFELWLSKSMFPSDTTIRGKYTLRVCFTNHRTKREDIDRFVDEVIKIGNRVTTHT
jgi:glutamate/tyrosine decarboxylase-like PLP-dependent enzyme